jgi:hypothetical protein
MANIERLERLVTVLEGVAADPQKRHHFDMGTWATEREKCGTTACACGWGAADPVLKAQGLALVPAQARYLVKGIVYMDIAYEDALGMDAVAAFFGISFDDAVWLFDEVEYIGDERNDDDVPASSVIDRLNTFIADLRREATASPPSSAHPATPTTESGDNTP